MAATPAPEPAAAPSPAATARRLIRAADRATLATVQGDAAGWPYASLVLLACDHDAAPLLLISALAEHTRNLEADPRVSLLVDGTAGLKEPLTGARVSLLGRAARTDAPRHAARFLARHPSAAMYAGFADFGHWRIEIERAHLVAGFGRIHWLDAAAVMGAAGLPLEDQEPGIVEHMNADHADAVDLYANRLLGLAGSSWRMTGCDAEGADLRRGGAVARLDFARPIRDAEGARAELVRLVKAARRTD